MRNSKLSQVQAKLSTALTSAKRVRIVMDLIRNKDVVLAERILEFHPSKGARILSKVLKSAVSNATNNYKMIKENLKISEVYANEASVEKRFRPASKGRISPILKRRSHIVIGLSERSK